jgi:Gas vesicle synthesis protein GvpL/GvpF
VPLHLYALIEHPARLPAVAGIDGSKLRVAEISGGIDAVVSDVSLEEGQPTEAAILAHADVVEQLAGLNGALLPARFGRGHRDEKALAEAIRERESQARAALERVTGCVEVGLRVFDETGGADGKEHGSGREYMLGRLEEVRHAERVAAELHESLAAGARESTCSVSASPQLMLSAAYLLPRAEVETFQLAVEAEERERPGLTFVCTGPWPPYSFAMIQAEGA